jgi:hypothetical protein
VLLEELEVFSVSTMPDLAQRLASGGFPSVRAAARAAGIKVAATPALAPPLANVDWVGVGAAFYRILYNAPISPQPHRVAAEAGGADFEIFGFETGISGARRRPPDGHLGRAP